jgi:NADPH2:quinone reductase
MRAVVVMGLSLGAVAHLVPGQVAAAAAAVTGLVQRGALREPAPAVLPLDRAAEAHLALEARSAPAKTELAVDA